MIALLLGAFVWLDRKFGEPSRRSDAILRTIDSLAAKRPQALSKGQWSLAVGSTHNLHCNSLLSQEGELDEIRRFQTELEDRVQGEVSMETINWIWDQYAELTEHGKRYQAYRDFMLEEMQMVAPNADPCGIYLPKGRWR